jgi:hypothetical protein
MTRVFEGGVEMFCERGRRAYAGRLRRTMATLCIGVVWLSAGSFFWSCAWSCVRALVLQEKLVGVIERKGFFGLARMREGRTYFSQMKSMG